MKKKITCILEARQNISPGRRSNTGGEQFLMPECIVIVMGGGLVDAVVFGDSAIPNIVGPGVCPDKPQNDRRKGNKNNKRFFVTVFSIVIVEHISYTRVQTRESLWPNRWITQTPLGDSGSHDYSTRLVRSGPDFYFISYNRSTGNLRLTD